MLPYDNCPSCFKPTGGMSVCPHCKRDRTKDKQYVGVLPVFTLLNKRYLLGRVLGKGGFGITYIAQDITNGRICAVKEYMPSEYATRNGSTQSVMPFNDDKSRSIFEHGRAKFVDEVRTLIKLGSNPNVVDILDYFEQNNTAYLVMEFLNGGHLRERAKQNGGKLEPEFAKTVFVTVASALMEIHKRGILHRDLSPENIMVTKDGRIKMIDFGAARSYVSNQNKGMSILLKPGFAPPEQYSKDGKQGPWSDVYALCATFYTLVSGKPLVDALFRYRGQAQPTLAELGCLVTKKTSDVINKGMELDIKKRYKDFMELLNDIDIVSSKSPKPHAKDVVMPPPGKPQNPPAKLQPPQSPTVKPVHPIVSPVNPPAKPVVAAQVLQPYVAAVRGGKMYNKVLIGTNDIFKIGRSVQSCHYTIGGDMNISRTHCYIRFDGKNIYLCDMSNNGTFLENGTRLMKNKEQKISPGTKFYLATKNHMLIFGV